MKKIPTVFERDWEGDRSRVTDRVNPGCEWVLAGEGIATRKLDGTCCLIRDGKLYKRRELRKGEIVPPMFERAYYDEETGKTMGGLPVGSGPEDCCHREAFERLESARAGWPDPNPPPDGTYELVGPKVQCNPERWPIHDLVSHDAGLLRVLLLYNMSQVPRTFEGLQQWLSTQDIEGLVFHHPDGRMAKIKLKDFGLKRKA